VPAEVGTVLGTLGAFFDRSVQKTEGQRDKATVFLTVAFDEKRPAPFGLAARFAAEIITVKLTIGRTAFGKQRRTFLAAHQKSIEHDGIRNGVASLAL